MEIYNFDFLVIGSGLTGLSTAVLAAEYGSVGIITKGKLNMSASYYAQGGIAAVISKNDRLENHYNDTLTAGCNLCNNDAVKILVSDGVRRVEELIEMGMQFDKINDEIVLGLEGAHSHNRILHANGDATGRKIIEFFTEKVVKNKKIKIFENIFVYKLLVNNNICNGCIGYNYLTKKEILFTSSNTMLATGGAAAIYSRTTNPKSSTGEGIYLAYEAGAKISNIEFVQFHPSSLVTDSDKTFLISEAVRGEGAYLVNSLNKRFMLGKHQKAELAPRDIIAYEIYKELQITNNKVYLTLSHLDANYVRKRFQNINRELQKYNLDIATDLIPVAPAAHYMIGGVKSGLNGETNIDGLYVAGEIASTGVHGANRLASNSLLECLVFSKRAVAHSQKQKRDMNVITSVTPKFYVNNSLQNKYYEEKNNISKSILKYLGIIRNESDMYSFREELIRIKNSWKIERNEFYSFQLMSILSIAIMITEGALKREESRGAHKRSDFTFFQNEYELEIIQQKNRASKLEKIN